MSLTCYRCGQRGHFAKDCPNEEARCYRCGKSGHFAVDCTEEQSCYKCGEKGHMAKDCPNQQVEGKEHRRCYRCGETGHLSTECPNMKCFHCGQVGHFAKDCPNREISDNVQCYRCGGKGHFAKDCTAQIETRKCYKCGEVGHLASQCPQVEGSLGDRAETLKSVAVEDGLSAAILKMGILQQRESGVPLMQSMWMTRKLSQMTNRPDDSLTTNRDRSPDLLPTSLVKPVLKKRLTMAASLSNRLIMFGFDKLQMMRRYRLLRLK